MRGVWQNFHVPADLSRSDDEEEEEELPPPMANPSTKPAREASPITMHIAATRLLLLLPIFGTVGWTEDIAGKVLLAAVIVESIDLRGNERIAVTNKDTGTEEAQMMESAGAAEPSSETDSIHSFTLKSGSRIYRPARTTAGMPRAEFSPWGCRQIRKFEFCHS